ncbi:hypothetical protein ABAC460_12825 [Asticcacaulis sp. AC460]|uniref:sodium:solute symporter family transporter n=1 Tax=Asticcacaulis sp. AC460 TaxID=1282360 RepID=UPI0003C3D164|nr:sodium/solute symporter [Asticcacaulis sp. AC460]ESQ89388.1 hypothetical protein ABAC460_12825 [Asticcacaulis sp. AC460]
MLSGIDIAILAGYVAAIIAVGLWHRRRSETASAHFLARESASWPRMGFALYASTLGATSLVGLTGTAYAHGIAVFAYEWMAALVLPVFCVFILPIYLSSRVFTVPEFLERRYGRFVRTYVSGLTVVLELFLEGAGGLFGGAILFQSLVPGWPLWAVCGLLAGLSGLFLLLGGLRGVILVESVQGVVVVTMCAALAWCVFAALGGPGEALARLEPERLKLIMGPDDATMPWIGLVTGIPLIGFYYWCANQSMVQRMLAAKSLDHGRWGSLMGGAMKLTTLFLVILPGAAAVLLFPDLDNPDQVFPKMVFGLLPQGLVGIVLAACLISILSSLASVYNATSTLLTMDFIRRLRPGLDDRSLIRIGRVMIVVVMAVTVAWAPQIGLFKDTLWQYLQAVMCYFVPPVAAVFLAGLFLRQANGGGARIGLVAGTVAGVCGFVGIEILDVVPLHFQVAALVVFGVALVGTIVGSRFFPPEDEARIRPLMYAPGLWQAETERLKSVKPWLNYRYLSLGLIGLTLALVFVFR